MALDKEFRTFRVCGIPTTVTKDQLEDLLLHLSPKVQSFHQKITISLAPCESSQIATVTFRCKEPLLFAGCKVGDRTYWDVEEIGARLVIDCDFLGITTLYGTHNPTVDIIAVTGLSGHAFGSWRSRTQNQMWLRDFLPVDLPDANIRVLTFGYDLALKNSTSTSSIHDFSRQLMDGVNSVRMDVEKERNRAIIFIGHSLGGLVIKQALSEASFPGSCKNDQAILKSCVGLFFFGVPNRGLNNDNLGTLVNGQNNSRLIGDLREGSPLLRLIHQNFIRAPGLKDCEIISFYETKDTKTVIINEDGNWERSGPMVRMVTQDSATFSMPMEAVHDQKAIDADHSDMVKFSDNYDRYYIMVRDRLQECVRKAPTVIQTRLSANRTDSTKSSTPLFMVPFFRNEDFTGREDILQQLEDIFCVHTSDRQVRAVLHGLGGIGKTTIASEFCYRRREVQPQPNIFWVHGDSHETFNASFLEIGDEVGVNGVSEESRLKQTKKWLESSAGSNWIMIVDSFDEVDLYIAKYLPVSCGTILFTTRNAQLVGHPRYSIASRFAIRITAMNDEEGLDMFSKLLGPIWATTDTSTTNRRDLLGLLDNLPLAITQAAAYIRETNTELSEYLTMFKDCESNQYDLLAHALPNATQYQSKSSCAVTTTWKITIDKIQQENQDSIQLLELMSFLNPDEIPDVVLKRASFLKDMRPVPYKRVFAPLLRFALLDSVGPTNYRLHRLVSFWVREQMYMKAQQHAHTLLETVIKIVKESFPEDIEDNLRKCTRLLSHALVVLGHASRHDLKSSFIHDLCHVVGSVFHKNGDYTSSLEWYQRALASRETVLGMDHPDTIDTVHNMAHVFTEQGKYSKALEWFQRVLASRETILGTYHPDTINTVHNMAHVFAEQGKYSKALEWYQRALVSRDIVLGRDHPDTINTIHNMAHVFAEQGKYSKALRWYQYALASSETVLGTDHPDTINTVHNMAHVFAEQGKYSKALEWFQRALDCRKTALGTDHPKTINTVLKIAHVFKKQKNYSKRLEYLQRAVDSWERIILTPSSDRFL